MVETIVCIDNDKFEIPLTIGKKYLTVVILKMTQVLASQPSVIVINYSYQ